MRKLLLILALVFVSSPAVANETGTVARANLALSLYATNAFVEMIGTDLSSYGDREFKLCDHSETGDGSHCVSGYLKTAGGSASFSTGSELITAWSNASSNPFETWSSTAPEIGSSGSHVINSSVNGRADFGGNGVTDKCFRFQTTPSIASGDLSFATGSSATNFSPTGDSWTLTSGSVNTIYLTSVASKGVFGVKTAVTNEFYTESTSCKNITGPTNQGMTVVSTLGGSTQSWATTGASFIRNDASGYSYTIYDATTTSTTTTTTTTTSTTSSSTTSTSVANSICVGPAATGDGSGSDWSNTAQWSTLTPERGYTYFLQDGTYGSKTLSTAASGTDYIYIKKATESAHGPATGWSSAYGDGTAVFDAGVLTISTSYWDISGVTGGGPGSWKSGHGIEFTADNTSSDYYIVLPGTVSNIFIRHIYFNQTGNTETGSATGGAIYSDSASELDNSTIEYCYFDNLGATPFFLRRGSGIIIQYNYTGDVCGSSVHDYDQHCEALVMQYLNNMVFRYNYMSECPSTGCFAKNNSASTSDNISIYGNVFNKTTRDVDNALNGNVAIAVDGYAKNWKIFNNTFDNTTEFISVKIAGGFDESNLVYNNLGFHIGMSIYPGTHGYNWLSQATVNCTSYGNETENIVIRRPSDCDVVTETDDPFVNSTGTNPEDFALTADNVTGLYGIDICASLRPCTASDTYGTDMMGNTRGLGGGWDVGALEYNSATTTSTASTTSTSTTSVTLQHQFPLFRQAASPVQILLPRSIAAIHLWRTLTLIGRATETA